jgi:hypothetical protein
MPFKRVGHALPDVSGLVSELQGDVVDDPGDTGEIANNRRLPPW